MYRTVYDLSREELDELRESYFYQLRDNDDEVLFAVNNPNPQDIENIISPKDISDDIIFEHYSGISFVKDDFFCNQKGEE